MDHNTLLPHPIELTDAEMDQVVGGYVVENRNGLVCQSNPNQHAIDNGFQGTNHNDNAATWQYGCG